MSTGTDSQTASPPSIVRHGMLWSIAVPLIVVGASLNVYGQDIAHWISDLSDPLKIVVSEYILVIARGVLMPIGAVLITVSLLVRSYDRAAAVRHL